jgi:uncharacterized protein YndB with AHSA1/START domain
MKQALIAALLLVAAGPAGAEVKATGVSGFEVANTATVKAPPDRVYAALLEPGKWWNPQHSYSGDAANLSIEARIGGCFCEKLPNGGAAQHQIVVYLAPGQGIGLRGPLGPLAAEGADGTLFWRLKPEAGGGTVVEQQYAVGGFLHGDAAGWAAKVDYVLGEQLTRFQRFIDTGSPEPAK